MEIFDRQYWTRRASVRKFSNQPVDMEQINTMLEQASHAPTTGNMQLYSVIVTSKKENLESLTPAHFSQPAMTGAPVVLTFCADFNRFVKWCELSGAEPGYENFQSFIAAVLDTVIFAQQFVTIAEMSGLGTCYLGTTTYNAPQIAKLLKLPKRVIPVLSVALGWPEGTVACSDRLPAEAIIHSEHYIDPTPEDITRYHAYKESLAENKQFVKENNKETLAQVFTDIRYPKANNEYFSKVYRDFIAQSGFPFPE